MLWYLEIQWSILGMYNIRSNIFQKSIISLSSKREKNLVRISAVSFIVQLCKFLKICAYPNFGVVSSVISAFLAHLRAVYFFWCDFLFLLFILMMLVICIECNLCCRLCFLSLKLTWSFDVSLQFGYDSLRAAAFAILVQWEMPKDLNALKDDGYRVSEEMVFAFKKMSEASLFIHKVTLINPQSAIKCSIWPIQH